MGLLKIFFLWFLQKNHIVVTVEKLVVLILLVIDMVHRIFDFILFWDVSIFDKSLEPFGHVMIYAEYSFETIKIEVIPGRWVFKGSHRIVKTTESRETDTIGFKLKKLFCVFFWKPLGENSFLGDAIHFLFLYRSTYIDGRVYQIIPNDSHLEVLVNVQTELKAFRKSLV